MFTERPARGSDQLLATIPEWLALRPEADGMAGARLGVRVAVAGVDEDGAPALRVRQPPRNRAF